MFQEGCAFKEGGCQQQGEDDHRCQQQGACGAGVSAAARRHQEMKSLSRENRKVGHAAEMKQVYQQMVNLKKRLEAPMKTPKTAAERTRQEISYCYKRCILHNNTIHNKTPTFYPVPEKRERLPEGVQEDGWQGWAFLGGNCFVNLCAYHTDIYKWWLFNYFKCRLQARKQEEGGLQDSHQRSLLCLMTASLAASLRKPRLINDNTQKDLDFCVFKEGRSHALHETRSFKMFLCPFPPNFGQKCPQKKRVIATKPILRHIWFKITV